MKYFIIFCLLLSGCSRAFYKDGATKADFQRDHTNCLVKASQAGFNGGSFSDNFARARFMTECMEGQGWERR